MNHLPYTILFLISFLIPSLQMDYDTTIAFEMLRASSAAYCYSNELQDMNCGPICQDLVGYQYIQQYTYNITGSEAVSFSTFVNPDKQMFITAFRGTQGLTQLVDELFEVRSVAYDIHDIDNAVVAGYFYNKYVEYLRNDFLDSLQQATLDYPDCEFYIVGHSLGGAFATLAALDASLEQVVSQENIHLYTYGSPRVGNIDLAQAVVGNVGEIYRITHHKDIVPHLPPCVMDLSLDCVATPDDTSDEGKILFHPWHVWPEVYYSTNTEEGFEICDDAEDPACSDQFRVAIDTIADHLLYLGFNTSCPNGISL